MFAPPRRSLSLLFALDRSEPIVSHWREHCREQLAAVTEGIAKRYAQEQAIEAFEPWNERQPARPF